MRGCAPTPRRSVSTSQPRDTHQTTSFLGAARSADDGHQQQCDEPVARRPHCHSGRRSRFCAPREALPAPGPHSTARCMLITHARIQTRIASARPSGRVQDGTSRGASRSTVLYRTALVRYCKPSPDRPGGSRNLHATALLEPPRARPRARPGSAAGPGPRAPATRAARVPRDHQPRPLAA